MPSRLTRLLLSFLLGLPQLLAAQNSQCVPFTGNEANLCNAAVDGITILHPVVGQIISGGNPELGRVGMLGGLGHFAVTFRANATRLTLPDTDYDGSSSTVLAGDEILAGDPAIDVALGVFGGLESGLLAVDLLGTLQLLPAGQDEITIDPAARRVGDVALGYGYGARVGIFGGDDTPFAMTTSLMRRHIPTYTYQTGSYAFGTDLVATNLRAVIGWQASVVSVGVGGGIDWYQGEGFAVFADPAIPLPPQRVPAPLNSQRLLVFADLALIFPVVSLAAEIGYQLGEDDPIGTTFEGYDPAKGLLFLSAGLKVGL